MVSVFGRVTLMINSKPTIKSTAVALLYLAPVLVLTIIFTVWPLCNAFFMSLYENYNYFTNEVASLGGSNFSTLFHDPEFWLALKNSLLFVLLVVPITALLSLTIALLINKAKIFKHFFQTIYFLPFVTSSIAVSIVWNWIFQSDDGLINLVLHSMHIQPINWLNDPRFSLFALAIICIWQGLGLNIILFLAGLNHIDKHLYSIAKLDNASTQQQFLNITWPLLMPITLLVVINTTIHSFKTFDQIYALFHGSAGPANADLTIMYYLYQKFYVENQYGLAAASGVVLFVILSLITLLGALILKRLTLSGGDKL